MKMAKSVDEYLEGLTQWQEELTLLREVVLETGLEETVKWGMPTYQYNKKNVLGLGAFKAYWGMWFFQGALLNDEFNVLINAQEGKTQAMRQWRFQGMEEIEKAKLHPYIYEAIENERLGKAVPIQKKPLVIPPELDHLLKGDSQLAVIFEDLKLTQKREFVEHVAQAKRADTKVKRLEKVRELLLQGKGLNDRYRK